MILCRILSLTLGGRGVVFKCVPLRTTLGDHHPVIERPGLRSPSSPSHLCTTTLYSPRFRFFHAIFI